MPIDLAPVIEAFANLSNRSTVGADTLDDKSQDFWREEYVREKHEIRRVDGLLEKAWKSVATCHISGHWPYEIADGQPLDVKTKWSASTTCMILFAFMSRWGFVNSSTFQLTEKKLKTSDLSRIVDDDEQNLAGLVPEILDQLVPDALNPTDSESSFGESSPLTWSWFLPILAACSKENSFKQSDVLWKYAIQGSLSILKRLAPDGQFRAEDMLKLSKDGGKPAPHSFPVVRGLRLRGFLQTFTKPLSFNATEFKSLSGAAVEQRLLDELKTALNKAPDHQLRNWFEARLHQHLAFAGIPDAPFDAAELAFSLEGLLLCDNAPCNFDRDVLRSVFRVLENRQDNNPYWRPLKPLVVTPKGFALLPLSVEIVNALFRCCELIEERGHELFGQHRKVFRRYFEWIETRKTEGYWRNSSNEPIKFHGWYSEHLQQPGLIHAWETCQVLQYLARYKQMVQHHLASAALKAAHIECQVVSRPDEKLPDHRKLRELSSVEYWTHAVQTKDPREIANGIYCQIRRDFLDTRAELEGQPSYSMVLYGPPGTGKTDLAIELAKALNWRFIEITPSNFVASGEAGVELRAKQIFDALVEQDQCVVLFDEIDRLILDRDSPLYSQQGDMFQVMTPGMLPKLKKLRSEKKCVFIIATNYLERIDPAAIRVGRIDEKYLVGLPSLDIRKSILCNRTKKDAKGYTKSKLEVTKGGPEWAPEAKDFSDIAEQLPLANYGEICQLVSSSIARAYQHDSKGLVKETILKFLLEDAPKQVLTARVSAFRSRFSASLTKDEKLLTREEPIEEFMDVLALILETKEASYSLSLADKQVIASVIRQLCEDAGAKPSLLGDRAEIGRGIRTVSGSGELLRYKSTLDALANAPNRWFPD